MSEEFTISKLDYLLTDLSNINHNCMFIQLFPSEIIDEMWNNLSNSEYLLTSENNFQILEFIQLILIAFGSEDSIPGKIRNGEIIFSNRIFSKNKVLTLSQEEIYFPKGMISEIINAIEIKQLVLVSNAIAELFFESDYMMSAHQLQSFTLKQISKSTLDLSDSLFVNTNIEKLTLVDVSFKNTSIDLSQMTSLRSLEVIGGLYANLPTMTPKLESLVFEKSNSNFEIDFKKYNFYNLKKLVITHNKKVKFLNVNSLINLTYLDVSSLKLKDLDVSELNKLQVLIARRNNLITFPNLKESAESIRIIDLSFNNILISEKIIDFPGLEQLIFEGNQNFILGELFLPFKNVFHLNLAGNDLMQLETSLINYKRLIKLNLENNQLKNVYDILSQLPSDQLEIKLTGNGIDNQEKIKLSNLEHINTIL